MTAETVSEIAVAVFNMITSEIHIVPLLVRRKGFDDVFG